jgi:hypothetical protein
VDVGGGCDVACEDVACESGGGCDVACESVCCVCEDEGEIAFAAAAPPPPTPTSGAAWTLTHLSRLYARSNLSWITMYDREEK